MNVFAQPWALLALAWIPLLVWLHRRARPEGDAVFTAWFLLDDAGAGEGRGRRLRAPLLLAARVLAVVALTLTVAGPRFEHPRGTVVLAAGPVTPDPEWATPVTVVRAGRPPQVVTGAVAPVLGPPDWGGALLLGQRTAPGARIVRVAAELPPRRIVAAGAALAGAEVIVTAAVTEGVTPVLRQGDQTWPMAARNGDWAVRGALPAGPAEVVAPGVAPWPVCLPDRSPLTVAQAGWPPAVEAVLAVLPDVQRVPADTATWRPGRAPPGGRRPAPFAPEITWFEFAQAADRPVAPLWFADDLPPPGAVVRRWRALDRTGEPVLLAGDAVAADRVRGARGAARRFGFDPRDTDLPETAGWPVLFHDAAQADRAARGRCLTHEGGRPLVVAVSGPVQITAPDGTQREAAAEGGRALIDGLDQAGHWRLRAEGVEAHLAVRPPADHPVEAAAGPVAVAPSPRGPPQTRLLAALGGALLLIVVGLSGRWRAPVALAAVVAAGVAATDLRLGGRRDGPVVVAVDTSGSMPPAETAAAVAQVEAALRGLPTQRVLGADQVQGIGPGEAPLAASAFGGATRHGPLVAAAAAAAGPAGAVVLISDGRAPDTPVHATVPVFTVPIQAPGPDAWVTRASAVRIGEQAFVRIAVAADRAVAGRVRVGPVSVEVALGPAPTTVHAVVPVPARPEISVSVEVAADRQPRNDQMMVPLPASERREALVVGAAAAPWIEQAGLATRVVPAAGLAESGAGLARVALLALHDVPAGAIDPALVPRLRRWVAAGGLLLLSGRTQAFGPGGWAGTDLESLSPLRADPRPAGVGALGVTLAIDRSGSMAEEAGGIGPEGAGALAGSVAAGLGPADQIAVLAFGAGAQVLLPPTARDRALAAALPVPAISRGGTRLGPAVDRAVALFADSALDARVLVLISDGRFADADAAPALTARLRAAGVRVVAVLVGADPTREPLASLVRETDGVLVEAAADEVPRLTTASVLGAGRGGLLVPGGPARPGPAWAARLGGRPPAVEARVRVAARSKARMLASVGGDPVLAEWGLGRGRVVALATDAWALSPAQWAGLLSPATAPRPRDARLTVAGEWLVYHGSVDDPPPVGSARIRGRTAHSLAWLPVGPGEAWALLPDGLPPVFEVSTATTRGALVERLSRPIEAEQRITGLDRGALQLQAELTGGALVPATAARQAALARRPAGGWPAALVAGLLALILAFVDTWRWARPARRGGSA